ncbi:DUF1572 family protein [Spongiimicrobium salis]|uniref:DUF1572 family protein n=1 Tax=Spongiimicrobium salis TaxID=1667022 RepID=UPI00374DA780
MPISSLKQLYERNLDKLSAEISNYEDEKDLWKIGTNINNSGGNLCLHLIGNLNTFIGATLGNFEYQRQRELEFSLKDVPRAELLSKIEETKRVVLETLDLLAPETLQEEYPLQVFSQKTSIAYMLIHLTTHLTYHLGQINYHRRLITS